MREHIARVNRWAYNNSGILDIALVVLLSVDIILMLH